MKNLRAFDPGNRIVLACRPGLGGFFLEYGLADEIIEIDKRSKAGQAQALRRLSSEVWDYVIVPHESVRTAIWMRRVRASAGKIGFARWWNRPFFTRRVGRPTHLPDAVRQLSLLAAVDDRVQDYLARPETQELANPRTQDSPLDLRRPEIPEWASMQVTRSNAASSRKIFLAPGSVWATKRWTAQGYEELARQLLAQGFEVELVGSSSERELCERISARVPGTTNSAGQTSLAQLVGVLSEGRALVCNDSGAMHAAAAAGLPTVAVFGPTTLDLGFRPWNNRAVVVQRSLKCRPCGKHGPQVCPLGTHECMEKITAAQVLKALSSLL